MPINKLSIIGGGTMGSGIARVAAGVGIETYLCEKDEAASNASRDRVVSELDREAGRWSLTDAERRVLERRLEFGCDLERAAQAEAIIEAVDEINELKREIFQRLDQLCGPGVLLLTNTSTLSISQLASATNRPKQFTGMHFVNPVPETKIVEVVRGLETSDETVAAAKDLARQLGKTPIEVYEYPGFVTTRLILPLINEAIWVLMEGVATAEDIDTAMKLGYNFERGPLELADHMGLEEVMSAMQYLFQELGDLKYRPCPLLRKMVRAGRLGVKTGEGFFKYNEAENHESSGA